MKTEIYDGGFEMKDIFESINNLEREKGAYLNAIEQIDNEIEKKQSKCSHEVVLITKKVPLYPGYQHKTSECLFCRKNDVLSREDRKQKVIDLTNYKKDTYKDELGNNEKRIEEIRNMYRHIISSDPTLSINNSVIELYYKMDEAEEQEKLEQSEDSVQKTMKFN